jgi:hypothetical protein
MFAEFQKIMDFAVENDRYEESLEQNIFGKKSADSLKKTMGYLKALYSFDLKNNDFLALKHCWNLAEEEDKPLLAFLFAINSDELLSQSISVVAEISPGNKVTIEALEENIQRYQPNRYSAATLRSAAQNIASSWKQAGFIHGKVKNIRTLPIISPLVATFAFFLAFLNGCRGELILTDKASQALLLSDSKLRELASAAARKELIQYQHAGDVTMFSFSLLIQNSGIHVI